MFWARIIACFFWFDAFFTVYTEFLIFIYVLIILNIFPVEGFCVEPTRGI
jgi:hypothetical protein